MSLLDHRATPSHANGEEVRRAVHLVGSLPPDMFDDQFSAMKRVLDHVDPQKLTALPADLDARWIIRWLDSLRARGPFELVLDGDSSDYMRMPVYKVRHGHRLELADVSPARLSEVPAALAARRKLRVFDLPPHQVSMPAPLDLALFAFGVPAVMLRRLSAPEAIRAITSALRYLPVFTAAVIAEILGIQRIARKFNDEIVIQLESPAVLVAYDRTPRAIWPALTRLLAGQTAHIIRSSPPETSFLLHKWCRGDLGHKPIASLTTLRPWVDFANALAGRLDQAERSVPAMHVALCDGESAPSQDAKRYAPLRALRSDIRLIAGLVDERHPDLSAAALERTEQALGRPVDGVAAACGLGRRSVEDAAANIRLALALAAKPLLSASSQHTRRSVR